MREIKEIYVHALGSAPSEDIGQPEIERLHGARGIHEPGGYHAGIRRNGVIEKGRPIERQGAGVKGHNKYALHIWLAGGLKEDGLTIFDRVALKKYGTPDANFTRAQYASLERLLDSYFDEFPDAVLKGHRDAPGVAKACPCFDVRAWYGVPRID